MDKKVINLVLYILLIIPFLIFLLYSLVYFSVRKYILPIEKTPSVEYALVLGAGLERNGSPSDILKDRILTSVNLFNAGKVKRLIMSGSLRRGKNEPDAMKTNALSLGLPESAIIIDPHGISTLNSCINTKLDYAPANLIIVTQHFHLPRAILLQRALGIKAIGIAACIYQFSWYKKAFWQAREMLSLPYNLIKLAIYLLQYKDN